MYLSVVTAVCHLGTFSIQIYEVLTYSVFNLLSFSPPLAQLEQWHIWIEIVNVWLAKPECETVIGPIIHRRASKLVALTMKN